MHIKIWIFFVLLKNSISGNTELYDNMLTMDEHRGAAAIPFYICQVFWGNSRWTPYTYFSSLYSVQFSSVQSLSHVQLFATPSPQYARPPCPPPIPRVHPNPCLLSCDAIQPPHPLSSPCPPALNLSQHQHLFKWVSSPHQVAKLTDFKSIYTLTIYYLNIYYIYLGDIKSSSVINAKK